MEEKHLMPGVRTHCLSCGIISYYKSRQFEQPYWVVKTFRGKPFQSPIFMYQLSSIPALMSQIKLNLDVTDFKGIQQFYAAHLTVNHFNVKKQLCVFTRHEHLLTSPKKPKT